MKRAKTQIERIEYYLSSGKTLTPIQALNKFGCFRLAAVIFKLKGRGMRIETRKIKRNGKIYAGYKKVGGKR